jgi:hypothetical protein
MEKEFIPVELALRLKALGFNETCFGYRDGGGNIMIKETPHSVISAPTFSQAFRFFREKYMIGHDIMCPFISYQGKNVEIISEGRYEVFLTDEEQLGITDEEFYSMTYNEAEIKCLNLLLRIVESKTE